MIENFKNWLLNEGDVEKKMKKIGNAIDRVGETMDLIEKVFLSMGLEVDNSFERDPSLQPRITIKKPGSSTGRRFLTVASSEKEYLFYSHGERTISTKFPMGEALARTHFFPREVEKKLINSRNQDEVLKILQELVHDRRGTLTGREFGV
jgi:hypothetical protein